MASNKKAPYIVAAVVIAAVAIGTIVARRSGDIDSASAAAQRETQAQALPPSRAPARTAGSGSGAALDGRTRVEQNVARRREARQEQIRRSAEQRREAAEAFEREQVDPAWAPKKEVELTGIAAQPAFETAGAVPKDMRVDCKSSMCRVDGSFSTAGQAEDWVLMYMSSVGSALPNAVVTRTPSPDGSARVEIYGRAR